MNWTQYPVSLCPSCALEDAVANPGIPIDQATYGRCEWVVGLVDCCHKHNVRLVSRQAPVKTLQHLDVGYEAGHLLENLQSIVPEHGQPDAFQRYVLSRIGSISKSPSELLDPLPLVTVAQLCYAAGRDVLRRAGQSAPVTNYARRAAGFDLLGHGLSRFESRLIDMRAGMVLSELARSIFPRLTDYLTESVRSGREIDEFRGKLAGVIFKNLPYAAGQSIFGQACRKRHIHDYTTAMATYGIGRHHLRAFALGTPSLVAYAGKRIQDILIIADVADELFLGRTPYLSSQHVSRLLGRRFGDTRVRLATLSQAGLLRPERGASTVDTPAFFSGPEFNQHIEAFFAKFDVIEPPLPNMVGVFDVTYGSGIPDALLWQLLASGKVRQIGRVAGEGIVAGIRLNKKEVLTALTGVVDPHGILEASRVLGIGPGRLLGLIARRQIPAFKVPKKLGLRCHHLLAGADLVSFKSGMGRAPSPKPRVKV